MIHISISNVKVGDGRTLQATKIGDIQATFLVYGNKSQITLTNVLLRIWNRI